MRIRKLQEWLAKNWVFSKSEGVTAKITLSLSINLFGGRHTEKFAKRERPLIIS